MKISIPFLPVLVRGDFFPLIFFSFNSTSGSKRILKGILLNTLNYAVIIFASNYFHKKLSN